MFSYQSFLTVFKLRILTSNYNYLTMLDSKGNLEQQDLKEASKKN